MLNMQRVSSTAASSSFPPAIPSSSIRQLHSTSSTRAFKSTHNAKSRTGGFGIKKSTSREKISSERGSGIEGSHTGSHFGRHYGNPSGSREVWARESSRNPELSHDRPAFNNQGFGKPRRPSSDSRPPSTFASAFNEDISNPYRNPYSTNERGAFNKKGFYEGDNAPSYRGDRQNSGAGFKSHFKGNPRFGQDYNHKIPINTGRLGMSERAKTEPYVGRTSWGQKVELTEEAGSSRGLKAITSSTKTISAPWNRSSSSETGMVMTEMDGLAQEYKRSFMKVDYSIPPWARGPDGLKKARKSASREISDMKAGKFGLPEKYQVDDSEGFASNWHPSVVSVQRFRANPPTDPFHFTHYLNAALNSHELSIEQAHEILVDNINPRGDLPSPVDTVAWNILIRHSCKDSRWRKARELFNDMKKRGFRPNVRTFSNMFHGLPRSWPADSGVSSEASKLFLQYQTFIRDQAAAEEANPDKFDVRERATVIPITGYLQFLSWTRQMEEATEIFFSLPNKGHLAANTRTYTVMLSGLLDVQSAQAHMDVEKFVDTGKKIWSHLMSNKSQFTEVDAYLASVAVRLFMRSSTREGHEWGLRILQDYVAAPNDFKWPTATSNEDQLYQSPHSPPQIAFDGRLLESTFNLLLTMGEHKSVAQLYVSMLSGKSFPYRIMLNKIHLTRALMACAEMGDAQTSLEILKASREVTSMNPDVLVYHQALDTCAKSGDFQSTLLAFKLMTGISPDSPVELRPGPIDGYTDSASIAVLKNEWRDTSSAIWKLKEGDHGVREVRPQTGGSPNQKTFAPDSRAMAALVRAAGQDLQLIYKALRVLSIFEPFQTMNVIRPQPEDFRQDTSTGGPTKLTRMRQMWHRKLIEVLMPALERAASVPIVGEEWSYHLRRLKEVVNVVDMGQNQLKGIGWERRSGRSWDAQAIARVGIGRSVLHRGLIGAPIEKVEGPVVQDDH